MAKTVDIAKCREILKRLMKLGLPFDIEMDIKQWIDQKEREQG